MISNEHDEYDPQPDRTLPVQQERAQEITPIPVLMDRWPVLLTSTLATLACARTDEQQYFT